MDALFVPAPAARRRDGHSMPGPGRRVPPRAAVIDPRLGQLWRPNARAWYECGSGEPVSAAYETAKRAVDILVALVALPCALPILVCCIVLVKLDSAGPALLVQTRTGKGGRPFKMFKLRTMVRNAHELRKQYEHLNELSYPDFKITNDPRMTRCGRVLRRLSLDELPQLFNVLRGDMTLVGPRPTSFGPETYRLWHTARLDVTPGLTGLWQIGGRSDLDFDERLRLDIAYVRNRCARLDFLILVRTVTAVVSGRGAH